MAQESLVGQGLFIIEASRPHSVTHTNFGRIPLDERSARNRYLHLTVHNNHKRQTSMIPAGFEPTTPASKRSQTHALDNAVIEIRDMTF
jgi:hypothetical protein